ncbi:unnamed protein product [Adineta ricciae]|uniref:Uncharacterized protein n=1 Tax=Adineta ricciae TaxID=249248 RepID=A0A815UK43_ADIRI|nr:unnamed protein product [Adineta ricciae]CAF1523747.1 unnamed protein product [Adineta ricciae]
MTTNSKIISIPMAVRDIDECNDYFFSIKDEMYKNFVYFWTQHQRFTRTCDPQTCSRIFIVDGHQKANRLICQYKDVFDHSISEMGPVQTGCLFSPLRKGRNIDNRYCHCHQPRMSPHRREGVTTTCHITPTNEENLDRLALSEYINSDGGYDDKLCNVFRSGTNKKSKISSYGFLATFLNCSVIVGFTEQPCSEGS